MLAAFETAAEWRETKAGVRLVKLDFSLCSFHFLGVSQGRDSEAMDGAFAALSWDDSTVKASSLARPLCRVC